MNGCVEIANFRPDLLSFRRGAEFKERKRSLGLFVVLCINSKEISAAVHVAGMARNAREASGDRFGIAKREAGSACRACGADRKRASFKSGILFFAADGCPEALMGWLAEKLHAFCGLVAVQCKLA
ncbi:hypothetical protein D9M69_503790 [compost metagenome]